MWLNLFGLAAKTGLHVYQNRQNQKRLMSDAALLHAQRMAQGKIEYKGQVLTSHEKGFKDEIVLIIISAPIIVLAWGVFSDDAQMMAKIDLFFHHFGSLPIWFQTLWITVVASIFGIKGTQVFRNGGKKK